MFDTFQILGEKFRKEMSHEVDGLIFQPVPDVSLTFCEIERIKKI